MLTLLAFLTVLTGAVFILPADSPGQQKDKGNKKDSVLKEAATAQDYLDLAQATEVIGKLADVNTTAGTLTLTVEWSRWELKDNKGKDKNKNQKAQQAQQQLMRDYEQIMKTKNPVQRQQALAKFQLHLQQLQATSGANLQNMFQIVKASKDFELSLLEDVKVARATLERKYNDEGELIKYTAEELKKIKSPDIANSYKGAASDLRAGQSVRLYLSMPKKQDAKSTGKTDTTDKQSAQNTSSGRPQVRMALILEDDAGLPEPKDLPKNKKKR